MIKKRAVLFMILSFLAFSMLVVLTAISCVSAIDLEIGKKAINEVFVIETNTPAIFEFTIKNLGESDNFEIYSLVGVDIYPKGNFRIEKGQTKIISVEVRALESAKKIPGYYNFVYKIKGSNTGIQEDRMTFKIATLGEVIYLSADSINPESEETSVYFKNIENIEFEDIGAEVSSAFFSFDENFSLLSKEEKSFIVNLNKEKLKTLVAGPYILDAKLKIGHSEATLKSTIKFLEESGISTTETKEGILISRHEIEKKNEGNTIAIIEVTMNKNIISRLFTNLNPQPNKVERKGFTVYYTWQEELRPSESLKVIAKTNWFIPFLILAAIIIIIILSRIYLISDVILKKRINFVKTKGGEFALKVTIIVKARRFAERIAITDKLPPIVKLYERYGTITPDRIDEKNRRIEWNIESLDQDEERILSYIIYSKIGIVGRFELPPARAVYEREGKIKETSSNRAFFVSEARRTTEE